MWDVVDSSGDATFAQASFDCVQAAAAAARQDGEQLVWEVWDVVERDFLDARGAGFDRAQWAAARDAALAGGPCGHHASVRHRSRSPHSNNVMGSCYLCAGHAPRLRCGVMRALLVSAV